MANLPSQPPLLEPTPSSPPGPVECLGLTFPDDDARRAYFTERLRAKLQDPSFRQIEGFPIGSDEDILALSDPPYYTACPNPFLEEFIRHYGNPYDPATDSYHREPFAADVREGKNDPIYNLHSYHTKVPHKAIIHYLLHYTKPGDIILDGFCGTGMVGVAAQACSNGSFGTDVNVNAPLEELGNRRVVLLDLSPAATFISYNYNYHPHSELFLKHAQESLFRIRQSMGWLYQTSISGKPAEIYHTVWSSILTCFNCGSEIIFWDSAVDQETGEITDQLTCKQCGALSKKQQLVFKQETVLNIDTNEATMRGKQVPVIVRAIQGRSRSEKAPDLSDLEIIEKSENSPILDWYPTTRIDKDIDLWYERDYRPLGINSVDAFYTRRNLRVLAALWREAEKIKDRSIALAFRFALTGMQINLSRMNRWRYNVSFPYNPLSGTLYIGSLPVESNVFLGIENKLKRLAKTWTNWNPSYSFIISTGSSDNMVGIPDNSIDYIFIDPPFGSNIIYSDLSIIWESWLRLYTNTDKEAVVHRRKKNNPVTLEKYSAMMAACFCEMYRVLKPGRWMTVEFHNTKNSVWNAIQEALLQAGFVIADVRTLDKEQGTFKQVTAAGAVKQDLVISAYKPNAKFQQSFVLKAGSESGVWDFIHDHMYQLPVFISTSGKVEILAERQNYLLFDRMVAFHVQHGVAVPMSAAEFYHGLAERFPVREGMYFLPEQAAEYDKKRLTVSEVLQLSLIVTDESSAIQWIKQQLTKRPQTFQELHPQFMRELGGWQKYEMPLELLDLLEQNFLRYDGKGDVPSQIHSYLSTNYKELRNLPKDDAELRAKAKDRWYLPDPNKATDLEKLREKALLREFEEYRTTKQKRLKVFRLEAVRAGFKKAWQDRDYATIIAVAEKIPENVLQEDAKLLMWYDQALMRFGG